MPRRHDVTIMVCTVLLFLFAGIGFIVVLGWLFNVVGW